MNPRAVGVDVSITATGLAFTDGTLATVRYSKACTGDARLVALSAAVKAMCDFRPSLAVVEDLPTHAHGAGITGMAQGVVRLALINSGVPYALIPPASLKKYATGRGNATKADMRMAWYQRAGVDVPDDNQVDAAWLRAMGRDFLGAPLFHLPAVQRGVLGKLAWPDVAVAA